MVDMVETHQMILEKRDQASRMKFNMYLMTHHNHLHFTDLFIIYGPSLKYINKEETTIPLNNIAQGVYINI